MALEKLKKIAQLLRYLILTSTTKAGSGHPTSCFSAVEIVTTLFFGGFFNWKKDDPKNINNDRFILSKGHAAPLLYSLYVLLGYLKKEELMRLRQFNSVLQGHPIPDSFLVDVATGSLGQGLSLGLGMAMGLKLKTKYPPKIWVLLGDSEVMEGQIWEAVSIASFYQVDNLIAIVDVNRLGQRGETIHGWDLKSYQKKFEAFGWQAITVEDGHNFLKLIEAFNKVKLTDKKPKVVLAKTIKGKGFSFWENSPSWHGKALDNDLYQKAVRELGKLDEQYFPQKIIQVKQENSPLFSIKDLPKSLGDYKKGELIATRKAYGMALAKLGESLNNLVVLDAEVSNSTYSQIFKEEFPDRFFEMFIAEQNMISVAVGFSKVGFIPFCSSFSAFLIRAFDQIRMAAYSQANLKICGSHSGVSIGEDGVSQMGLEDLAMARSIYGSVVFYPSDAVSCEKLTALAATQPGIFYLKTTRVKTPVIYQKDEKFKIGGLKVLKKSSEDKVAVIGCGIAVFEILAAYEILKKEGVVIRVIDLYSIKPVKKKQLYQQIKDCQAVITVEDHYLEGGMGEVVSQILADSKIPIYHLAVKKLPRSGKSEELLHYEEIDKEAVVSMVKKILKRERKK